MKQTITLSTGEILIMNSDLITVRSRKEIRNKFATPTQEIGDDKVILSALEEEFAQNPPTQMRIYEAFLSLIKPQKENSDEPFFEELCRVCLRWKKNDTELVEVTEEEFQNLPFDVADYILKNLFTDNEKSFLVAPKQ